MNKNETVIFSVAIGTEGGGMPKFTAYLPFTLSPGRSISPFEGETEREVGNHLVAVRRLNTMYALVHRGSPTEIAGAEIRNVMRTALLWVSLRYKVGVRYGKEQQVIKLFDQPLPAPDKGPIAKAMASSGWTVSHGHYDADKPAVLPEHLDLSRWEMGAVSVHTGISLENFFEAIGQVLSDGDAQLGNRNPKFELALEIYGSFAFEASDRAQLLTLVTTVEALLPEHEIPVHAIEALEVLQRTLREHRRCFEGNPEARRQLERLASRLGNLKKESIGAQLDRYLRELVGRHPGLGNAGDVIQKLKEAYEIRSRLIHDGVSDIEQVAKSRAFLQEFVPEMLKVLFAQAVPSVIADGTSDAP